MVKKTYGFLNDPSLYMGLWRMLSPLLAWNPARRSGLLRPLGLYSALKGVLSKSKLFKYRALR